VEILALVNEVRAASPSNAIIGFYEARHLVHENAPECVGRDGANQQFERTRLAARKKADGISRLPSANGRRTAVTRNERRNSMYEAKPGGYRMKILVTGGTGRVGSEVVKELQKRKADIRLLVRKNDDPTPTGVEAAIGDLLDPVSVEKAMDGVDKLYLLNAVLPDELTQGLIAYDLAKKLKLRHVVYHSVFRVEHFKDVPHFASKLAIESALREFDIPFTIIRPNYFIQNDATLKDALTKTGIYPMPLGQVGISAVDIRDIAEAAAIALTSDGHFGKTYNLNGPEVLSGPKIASIWSGLLGKEIRYLGDDMDAFEEQMRKRAPSWSAFDIRMMFEGYLERGFIAEDGDLETLTKLLGHTPRRYEDFARETLLKWQEMSKAA
jgi:uncharacterized protein YbjT (DUF2867 family)